jgi:copper chaperone
MAKSYNVKGMTCGGCAGSVERAIKEAAPGAKVTVDLAAARITVEGATDDQVAKAVDDAGFTFEGVAG